MLTTYVKRQTTQTTYYSGPAGPHLDAFTHWLEQRGYRHGTIRHRLQGAAQFVTWAQTTGCPLPSLSPVTLEHFRHHLAKHGQLLHSGGALSGRWLGAQLFFAFLQAQQIIAPVDTVPEAAQPELLSAFEQWMHGHRGVRPSTLLTYRPHVVQVLTELGESPEQYDVAQLRTVILAYAQHHSATLAKTRVTAWRMFLRFLTATGRCQPDREAAIPPLAAWRLATLPRYVPPEDLERVIAACDGATPRGIRDKAIVLLLARLGLRAGEVAGLQLHDIDWPQGAFRVMGKSRREAKLPLPQDVGDAVLDICIERALASITTTSFSPPSPPGRRSPALWSATLLRRPSTVPVLRHHRLVPTSCGTRLPLGSCVKGHRSKSSVKCCGTARSRPPPIMRKST